MRVDGARRQWLKPIMFTGGLGALDAAHASKCAPERGMLVAKIGGPVYRIGVGGGAASSVQPHADTATTTNRIELDFNAVQRGDAEMGQKLNRFPCVCVECEVDESASECELRELPMRDGPE